MPKKLLIKLTPLEPYFFGNDKSVAYTGAAKIQKAGNYFVSSEDIPSQTTLFGILRYLGIENKKADYSLSPEDVANIGPDSYNLTDCNNGFGRIISISPLYLMDKSNDFYIKTPFDHKNDKNILTYTPFEEYKQIETSTGAKWLPNDYKAKKRIADGYMKVSGKDKRGRTLLASEDIFQSTVRTVVNTKNRERGFFKKEYKFTKDYAFAFFVNVEDGFPAIKDTLAYLGQGKSPFTIELISDITQPDMAKVFEQRKQNFAYAQSDVYLRNLDIKDLYSGCLFANVMTKDFRVFTTNYSAGVIQQKDRFTKGANAIKFISAGSIFVYDENGEKVLNDLKDDKKSTIAGFNHIILIGGNEG